MVGKAAAAVKAFMPTTKSGTVKATVRGPILSAVGIHAARSRPCPAQLGALFDFAPIDGVRQVRQPTCFDEFQAAAVEVEDIRETLPSGEGIAHGGEHIRFLPPGELDRDIRGIRLKLFRRRH